MEQRDTIKALEDGSPEEVAAGYGKTPYSYYCSKCEKTYYFFASVDRDQFKHSHPGNCKGTHHSFV